MLDSIEGYNSIKEFNDNYSTIEINKYLKEQEKLIKSKKIKKK